MIYKSKDDFLKYLNNLEKFIVLGIDFGIKKSGLALYKSDANLALPLMIFKEITKNLENFLLLLHNKAISAIVIGLPLDLNANTTAETEKIIEFAQILDIKIGLPIILTDERFTTSLANTLLKSALIKRKKRNQLDDAVAACILLENFFNSVEK